MLKLLLMRIIINILKHKANRIHEKYTSLFSRTTEIFVHDRIDIYLFIF